MINFRFHLVSLIAVFLSLALGVVVGSTVIDQAIVDGLEAQIERVERNADAAREDNGRLRSEIGELNDVSEQTFPFIVEDRLSEQPIVVIAVRGANEDGVRRSVEVIRQAGALTPAVAWIEEQWQLVDEDAREQLRDIVGVPRGTLTDLRDAALEALAARLATGVGAGPTPTTSVPPRTAREPEVTVADADADVLAALVESRFVSVDRMGAPEFEVASFPGEGARIALLTDSSAALPESVVTPMIRALADAPLLTLVADLTPPKDGDEKAPDPPVKAIRDEDDLADRISTIDDATSPTGLISTVLALEELGRGRVGHYGTGSGAGRRLPELPES